MVTWNLLYNVKAKEKKTVYDIIYASGLFYIISLAGFAGSRFFATFGRDTLPKQVSLLAGYSKNQSKCSIKLLPVHFMPSGT